MQVATVLSFLQDRMFNIFKTASLLQHFSTEDYFIEYENIGKCTECHKGYLHIVSRL